MQSGQFRPTTRATQAEKQPFGYWAWRSQLFFTRSVKTTSFAFSPRSHVGAVRCIYQPPKEIEQPSRLRQLERQVTYAPLRRRKQAIAKQNMPHPAHAKTDRVMVFFIGGALFLLEEIIRTKDIYLKPTTDKQCSWSTAVLLHQHPQAVIGQERSVQKSPPCGHSLPRLQPARYAASTTSLRFGTLPFKLDQSVL